MSIFYIISIINSRFTVKANTEPKKNKLPEFVGGSFMSPSSASLTLRHLPHPRGKAFGNAARMDAP